MTTSTTPSSPSTAVPSTVGMPTAVLTEKETLASPRDDKASLARRIFEGAKDTVLTSSITPVNDPVLRATEIKSDVLKYSVLSGVLGAFAIPGVAIATDLAVVCVQIKLVRDIGQRWGHKVDKQAAASLLGGLGLGAGARIAVSNLVKLVPGWGSVFGASASFASTWALGQIADKYFQRDMKTALAWSDFKAAEAEGRKARDVHQDLVGSKRTLHDMSLQTLRSSLKAGQITQQEYTARIEKLAGASTT